MPVSKNTIKYIQSLRQKKFRQKYDKFVVEGDKMVRELLEHRSEWVETLFALPNWMEHLPPQQWPPALQAITVSENELSRLSLLKTPNQALALVRQPQYELNADALNGQLALFLDDLQDPGNMGTLLRLADWFGISTVICSPNCVEVFNPKVIQASMGAFLRVSTIVADFGAVLNAAPDLTIFGADMEGGNIFQADLPKTGVLVIGNEGAGITPAVMEKVTHRVSIPRGKGGGAESLNAAVAAGIIIGVLLN
ncbi:TrmH family RNA methyltransferase [Phaeodactylibacter xiamenensis]|jgi:TrmH family RNA methyltransferase|uniref:TrmH family RNA methyltransferase n=1 Tax=Phaeodactylibacter xiamenensis TaxID=1524460 RepID=UPI003BAAA772